jgi:hypothetical protein
MRVVAGPKAFFITFGGPQAGISANLRDLFLQNAHKIVILRACDFFDLFGFLHPTRCFSIPSRKASS